MYIPKAFNTVIKADEEVVGLGVAAQYPAIGSSVPGIYKPPIDPEMVLQTRNNAGGTDQIARDAAAHAENTASAAVGVASGAASAAAAAQQAVASKQDALVSGANIKRINGQSVLGVGDLVIAATASTETRILDEVDPTTDYTGANVFDEGGPDTDYTMATILEEGEL